MWPQGSRDGCMTVLGRGREVKGKDLRVSCPRHILILIGCWVSDFHFYLLKPCASGGGGRVGGSRCVCHVVF